MNPIILDERLSAAAELAREALAGRKAPVAADVGCDHGFLTAKLLEIVPGLTMLASDVSAPSLEKARRLLGARGLSERANITVADGLSAVDRPVDAVMILGMGSGTYASYCTRYFPGASVQGAEIDKKIADIATDYFGLPGSVTVAVEDGRAYLAASKEKFDVIMVDAYQDITIPFQLSSVEFFNEVQAHLKPNGVMVVNLNMTSAENGSINEYLCDTMASVFQHTVTAPVRGNTNTEVFCTNADDWEETFLCSIAKLKDSDYADMMRTVYSKLTPYEGGSCILTDDKAPVEVLGMRVLDELIGDELNYYKDELRTGGLSALIGN